MNDATFTTPDLTTFCRLDELGLVVTGQRLEPERAVLACRVVIDHRQRVLGRLLEIHDVLLRNLGLGVHGNAQRPVAQPGDVALRLSVGEKQFEDEVTIVGLATPRGATRSSMAFRFSLATAVPSSCTRLYPSPYGRHLLAFSRLSGSEPDGQVLLRGVRG